MDVLNTNTNTNISINTERGSLYVCMYMCFGQIYQSINQPGKVDYPARGQLNRENEYFRV